MGYAVRVPDELYVWLEKVYVEEGQSIAPGIAIADVILPDGMTRTIESDCHGIVAHVENAANDRCYSNQELICHIAKRADRNNRDGKLHPRPAPALRIARLGR